MVLFIIEKCFSKRQSFSFELFLDKKLFLCYSISRYQGAAGANAQLISSVRDLSPEFVLSSKTFTTASVVVKVFFIASFATRGIEYQTSYLSGSPQVLMEE